MQEPLKIENFKAWRSTGELRLAPLTVLFGPNSAGKSSLTQFLLMLKQTIESSDRTRVLHPGDRSTIVQLGTFRDLIFDHRPDGRLSFELSFSLPSRLTIGDPKSANPRRGDALRFSSNIRRYGADGDRLRVESMYYALFDRTSLTLDASMIRSGALTEWAVEAGTLDAKFLASARSKNDYRLDVSNGEPGTHLGKRRPLPEPIRFYGFPDAAVASYRNAGFLRDLAFELESQFRRLYYLGPLRGYPERSYLWAGDKPDHVGRHGERTVEALLAAGGRRISRGKGKHRQPFQALIARWLRDLGLIHSFEAKPIAAGRREHEVLIRVRKGGSQVNLTDVGFGLSQLLPVIVECFYVPANSTIIFEQPEIHLHPAVQAGLADLFIEAIRARENSTLRGIQLIVESHSEHFLRRLQRRVAEQALTPDEVAIYFCEPGRDGSTIRELQVDHFGNILNWPEHFFGDEMGDVAAMTDAAMERALATAQ